MAKPRLVDDGYRLTLKSDRRRDQWLAACAAVLYTLFWGWAMQLTGLTGRHATPSNGWAGLAVLMLLWALPTAALLGCFVGPGVRVEVSRPERTARFVSTWFGLTVRSKAIGLRGASVSVEEVLIDRRRQQDSAGGLLMVLGLLLGPLGLVLTLVGSSRRRGMDQQLVAALRVSGPPVVGFEEPGAPAHVRAEWLALDAQALRVFVERVGELG